MQQKKFLAGSDLILQRRIASSLLCAVADIFVKRIEKAVALYPEVRAITFAGGVACNRFITQKIAQWATKKGILFFKPSPLYCTDNGAMIAFVGQYRYLRNEFAPLTVDIL
jgi:N6-L-threonylcarbamoyladenine synthase